MPPPKAPARRCALPSLTDDIMPPPLPPQDESAAGSSMSSTSGVSSASSMSSSNSDLSVMVPEATELSSTDGTESDTEPEIDVPRSTESSPGLTRRRSTATAVNKYEAYEGVLSSAQCMLEEPLRCPTLEQDCEERSIERPTGAVSRRVPEDIHSEPQQQACDVRRAMDEYTSEIFMGGINTIAIHNVCEDSLLAAPLMIDLVVLTELMTRIAYQTKDMDKPEGFACILSILSYLLKCPMVPHGTPVVNALARQRECIENILRACIGLAPNNNMLLEYKTKCFFPIA